MSAPVRVKAVVVDPEAMTVVWMNEAAAQDFPDASGPGSVPLDRLSPLPEMPDALRAVAATGVARHLRTDLVSTAKGSVAVVTSIYRLPDGMLLMLTENAWQPRHGEGAAGPSGARRRGSGR